MDKLITNALICCTLFAICISASAQSSNEYDYLRDADELMTAAMSKLFDQNTGSDAQRYQWSEKYSRGDAKGNGNTTIWPQGFGLAALSQLALAFGKGERYDVYKQAADHLADKFPSYITTINGVRGYSVYGGTGHRFLDDNAWAALGLLDAYELEQKASYLTAAKMVANYMVKAGRLLEDNPPGGGGMYWQDSPSSDTNTYKTKNTANNGPAVVIFCRLYELTQEESYLNYARQTYQWLYDVLLDKSSWLMWDAFNVETNEVNKYQAPYTTGAMLHAASILYKITGEATYKQHADRIARAAFRRWFENYDSTPLGQNIKIVKTEGNTHSDDLVVLLRAYEAYREVNDNSCYLNALAQSMRHIWQTRRDAETGLMNYDWTGTATQDEWTSLGQTGYVEMYARLARANAKGWLTEGTASTGTVIEAENCTKKGGVTTENDSRCSGGKRVGFVGNGNTLTFTYNAEQEGIYELTAYYMTYGTRTLEITVNSQDTYTINCPSTNSWDGSSIGNITVDIALQAGANTIVVGNATGNAPNLDKFELNYSGPQDDEEDIDMTNALIATSPNGNLEVKVTVDAKGCAFYAVTRDGTQIITPSRLGFEGMTTFAGGIRAHSTTQADDPYDMLHGKASCSDNRYTQLLTTLSDGTEDGGLTVEFRVYEGGVAFRYIMEQGSIKTFSGELTEFNIADFKQALSLPYSYDYTGYYGQHPWADLSGWQGYNEPMLIQRGSDGLCILLTEAANYGETCGNSIKQGLKAGQLRLQGTTKTATNVKSTITYPFASAWRTLVIGTTRDIVESTMVSDLNPSSKVDDTSWICPGRVAWNWAGEDRQNTGDINVAKRYAELAAHLGWEYVLIDDGWEGKFRLEDFVPYAQELGVDVIVWYNNNKFSSSYNSCLTKLKGLADLGVKGVKIDFFDNDAQNTIKKYETLLRAAAEAHIMVDFHGCTRPTGWERTYPHLMTMEAVLGGEFLLDQPHMNQADHAVNLAVCRNVLGSMDFTPTKLAQRTGSLKTHSNTAENPYTTWSYQLALWTLFESGFQCLIDCPDNIIDSPIEPVLRATPTAWDETRCLEAEPSQYATLARRSNDTWHVATISKQQRTARIVLDFLDPEQEYTAYIYRDGTASQFDIAYQSRSVTATTTLSISVRPNGGATVIISPRERPDLVLRTIGYEAESATGGTVADNAHCSKGKFKTNIKGSTRVTFRSVKVDADGEYALTLYYMLPEETRHAYIQVGAEGDKTYYDFHTRDDYDRSKSLVLGMKTVYVQLKEGTNIIYYGSEEGQAPDLDKITVTPTKATQEIIDGINDTPAAPSTVEQTLRIENGTIVCTTLTDGMLTLFDTAGRVIQTAPVRAGETRVKPDAHGVVIVSLSTGSRAFARKVIL